MIHLLEVGEHLPTPAFLLGKSLGQRNLVGYSPWGHKALDMIEHLTLPSPIHTYIYIYNIYIIYIYIVVSDSLTCTLTLMENVQVELIKCFHAFSLPLVLQSPLRSKSV